MDTLDPSKSPIHLPTNSQEAATVLPIPAAHTTPAPESSHKPR